MSVINPNEAKLIELLSDFLADHFVLYVKTQNFHWHLRDPHFLSIHEFLGKLYNDLAEFIDLLGERILTLGAQAPGSISDYLKRSQLKESLPESKLSVIIETLTQDHKKMIETAKKICALAQDVDDFYTDDMMIGRIGYHQKILWLLSALKTK